MQTKLKKQKNWHSSQYRSNTIFLPGYGITIKNIEEATKAAKDRALHLNQLKERKNC